MPENFADLLETSAKTPQGMINARHIAVQLDALNKLYDDEATRDQAHVVAAGWLEHGSPLRKAAATAWAKEKHIAVGDQADPNAAPPKANDLSNGIDAPDSGPGAAGAGAAANDTGGKAPPKPMGHAKPKGKGNVIDRLRMMAARRKAPAAHATSDSTAAAYEAGVRDATAKHAHNAHRIGTMAARHAFALGNETGKRVGAAAQEKTQGRAIVMPTNAQAVVTAPGMGKARYAEDLAKAMGAGSAQSPAMVAFSAAKKQRQRLVGRKTMLGGIKGAAEGALAGGALGALAGPGGAVGGALIGGSVGALGGSVSAKVHAAMNNPRPRASDYGINKSVRVAELSKLAGG